MILKNLMVQISNLRRGFQVSSLIGLGMGI